MAIVDQNFILQSLRGMLGGMLVLRRRGGKTIAAAAPSKRRVTSAAQKAQQQKFKEAVARAKALLADAGMYAHYKNEAARKPGYTALNLAVSDVMQGKIWRAE